ncbi:MAG: RluA family pseudouridine synthase [Candidatus Kinetoplastibacterium crithidii]|nr:MAG: RluA family pseudouridine synthase [Candidatus Kinetoplastibacterium crithidii]
MKNINIDVDNEGQRLDNFLLKILKGVPKSHIYKIIRKGNIKINNKKSKVDYKLLAKDVVSLPNLRLPQANANVTFPKIKFSIIYEDDNFFVIDKPYGIAVHGGSGILFGVIEQLRACYKKGTFLELVHRLDRDTSGLLIVAKKRSCLLEFHRMFRESLCHKRYIALVKGKWLNKRQHIKFPLKKYITKSGERRVVVSPEGQHAHTIVDLIRHYGDYSLLNIKILSGRTHQIRVHLSHSGFPIIGDSKYGSEEHDLFFIQNGFKRMFLHAHGLKFLHPSTKEIIELESCMPVECDRILNILKSNI